MAAKTNEEIQEALLGLEPGNSEHWTTDGLPRLDAVENLLGASVTRKQVTNAAPDYNRGRAQSMVDEAHDEDTAGPVDDEPDVNEPDLYTGQQSPESPVETNDVTADDSYDPDADPLAEGAGDKEAELEAGISYANQQVEAIRQNIEQSRIMLEKAEQELAEVTKAKNSAFPPLSAGEAIQQFQRSELEKRAQARGVSVLDGALKNRVNATKPLPNFSG